MIQAGLGIKMETRQRIGRFGWGLIFGFSLLILLLPANYAPAGRSSNAWLLILLGVVLLAWLGLLLGVGLLFIRYFPFFQQSKGLLLILAAFMIGLRAFITVYHASTIQSWLGSQLFLLLMIWLLVLIATLPFVMSIYFWHQDRAAQLTAITFLVIVWLLVAYTRWRSATQIFQDLFQMTMPAELSGLFCFGILVLILAPLFFIGHSIRLIYRELSQADMLEESEWLSEPIAENAQ